MTKIAQTTQQFHLVSSKRLSLVFDMLHICALSACWLNSLPISYRALLTAIVLLAWKLDRKKSSGDVADLHYSASRGWLVGRAGGEDVEAKILSGSVVGREVIFLRIKIEGMRAKSLVIASDSLPEEDFRRLQVRLKLWAATAKR